MPAGLPLRGRTILITRPRGQGESLAARLSALGASVTHLPTLALEPLPEAADVAAAIERLDRYQWIVFASPSGVRFFVEAAKLAGRRPDRIPASIAAVGPGTARALRSAGLSPRVVADESHAEGLAAALEGHVVAGSRVLWVRPELTRDVLPRALEAMAAEVESACFYRSVAAPEAAEAAAGVARGLYEVVIFASPSSIRYLLEAPVPSSPPLEDGLRRSKRVAIGSVTAAALERAGFPADRVADRPSDEGIAEAVVRAVAD